MNISFEIRKGAGIVSLEGRLDASNSKVLKDHFQDYLSKSRNFVFDLGKLEFIDSTGLGAIVACLKYVSELNGDIYIAKLQAKPRMVFEITRAYKIFDVFDDVESALEAF